MSNWKNLVIQDLCLTFVKSIFKQVTLFITLYYYCPTWRHLVTQEGSHSWAFELSLYMCIWWLVGDSMLRGGLRVVLCGACILVFNCWLLNRNLIALLGGTEALQLVGLFKDHWCLPMTRCYAQEAFWAIDLLPLYSIFDIFITFLTF